MARRCSGGVGAVVALVGAVGLVPGVQAQSGTVYCRYMYYGNQYSECTTGSVAEAKKLCEENASKKHGETLQCWCTDDPEYVGNYCKDHAPKK